MTEYTIVESGALKTEPVVTTITNVTIAGAIYDALSLETAITDDYDIAEDWHSDSAILAQFDGNLYSGNAEMNAAEIDYLLIKRRVYGEFEWFNMFLIPIEESDDFSFSITDRYAAIGISYQYAVVPIDTEGFEGEYSFGIDDNTGEDYIATEYNGIVILDSDSGYESFYEPTIEITKNHVKTSITTLNDAYPYVVSNSASNYYSGTVGAVWVKLTNCYTTLENLASMQLRDNFMDFLVNNNFKILKIYDGRMFMVQIIDTITDSSTDAPFKHVVTFNFVEVGDALSNQDMYINGFLDLSEEWWS